MAVNTGNNPGFLLAEDAALKFRLMDITVSDDKAAERPVQVFYRHPEKTTEKTYPFMTIELVDIVQALDRQHSFQDLYYADGTGITEAERQQLSNIDYLPSEKGPSDMASDVPTSGFLKTSQLTPVDLIYQVMSHTRSSRHDRQLTALMHRRVVPYAGRSWIEIPEDGTIRRLELIGWRPADILDGEAGYKKRLFRKVYTLKMNAEIPTSDFISISRALSVEGELVAHHPDLQSSTLVPEEF